MACQVNRFKKIEIEKENKQAVKTMNKITVITMALALSFFAMPAATLLAQEGATPTPAPTQQPVAQAPVPAEQPTNQTPEPLISELPVVELPPAIEQEGLTITEPIEPVTEDNSDQESAAAQAVVVPPTSQQGISENAAVVIESLNRYAAELNTDGEDEFSDTLAAKADALAAAIAERGLTEDLLAAVQILAEEIFKFRENAQQQTTAVPSVAPDADPADDEKAANDAAQLRALYAEREQLTTTYYALLSERDRVQRGRATSLKFLRLVLSPIYFLYREVVDPNEISILDQQIADTEARLAALNRAIDRIVQRNQ